MDIRLIEGSAWTRNDGEDHSLQSGILILKDNMPVFRFLDAAGFDGRAIHKVRVACEIAFGFRTFLKYKPTGEILLKPERFSELIRFIDEKGLEEYRFVLDTEDKEALSDVIQQLLYLGLDLEVMLKREDQEARKMEIFRRMFQDLHRALESAQSAVSAAGNSAAAGEFRKDILGILSDMARILLEVHERNLKVAVMALKKSGKSVLVNCLLGGEYTPASIELPTFTTCVYRKSREGIISLKKKDTALRFESPELLKNYLLEEFRQKHLDRQDDYETEDLEITYVPAAEDARSYTVVDTPGPDLAGARHKDIAYRWIREADVILFIIDYSKHLTGSEEEFFRDIKEVFEEYGKFYSLIVVVNKLDLMYLSDEKKSGVRFIDFLRTRLMDLGYRGVIVLGVSALQYFYSLKAAQIEGCGAMHTYDGATLRETLDRCLVRYQGADEMTVFSFLDNRLRDLRWFHGKENATIADLRDTSGVGQLMKYIDYIAMEKAHVEVFNHKMLLVDRKYGELRDDLIGDRLQRLGEEKTERQKMAAEITAFIEETLADIEKDFRLESALNRIEKDMELARKSLNKVLTIHKENFMRQLAGLLKTLTGDVLVEFQKSGELKAVDNIFLKLEKGLAEKLYSPVLGKYCVSLNRELAEKEKTLADHRNIILEKVARFNTALGKVHTADFSGIQLSKLPDSFTKFDFTSIILMLDNRFAESLLKERPVKKRGVLGGILLILTLGLVNIRTGDLRFDEIKLKKALILGNKGLDAYTSRQVTETFHKLFEHINLHLGRLDEGLAEARGRFELEFRTVFEVFLGELNELVKEAEIKVDFLEKSAGAMEEFGVLWEKIRIKE